MLVSLVLTLESETSVLLPGALGRANYAALLERLNLVDNGLGRHVHDGSDGPKPVTCSDVLGAQAVSGGKRIVAGEPYQVRVTGLDSRTSQGLVAGFVEDPISKWVVAGHRFRVTGVAFNARSNVWSGQSSYAALAERLDAENEGKDRRVTLELASPTSFQSNGMQLPLPLPSLVFGSLVDRWNAFSPIPLQPEVRAFAENMMGITQYQLESAVTSTKNKGFRTGAVGTVLYTALGGSDYWLNAVQVLADFALFSGVGVKTTEGMGQVRRVG